MKVPSQVNQRWSMNFVSDQLVNGRRFRVLNVVDDYSREMVGQLVSTSISGQQVARFLNQLVPNEEGHKRWFAIMEPSYEQGHVFLEQRIRR